jgi:hypothetical protein
MDRNKKQEHQRLLNLPGKPFPFLRGHFAAGLGDVGQQVRSNFISMLSNYAVLKPTRPITI